MKLTKGNYYGKESNLQYMSVSQFKACLKCPAAVMAELRGEYTPVKGRALTVGSYVDEALTGTKRSFERFCQENHDELYQKRGDKKLADIVQADEAIRRVREQPLMLRYLRGSHQTILTGEIAGVSVKGKFDCYKKGQFISDLKYLKDFRSPNLFENAISYYGYDIQGAVYRELVRQNTGKTLPFYLVIVTKQSPADVAVVEISDFDLNNALDKFKQHAPLFQRMKTGEIPAERCESHDCPYCRGTKRLTEPIDSALLGLSRQQLATMGGRAGERWL